MNTASYSEVLAELERRGNYERTAQPRDLSKLAGIQQLLAELGHPEQVCQIVHIAGTNGKGLTSAMIAAILQGRGEKTGLYTSPHLVNLRERIAIAGQCLSPEAFTHAAQPVLALAKKYEGFFYLSYFDLLTAMALVAFAEAGCQWAVLETGLGGLADSTNAPKDKRLAVLTRIGYDHLQVLGETLEAIAHEKLGIARPGVPTILAEQLEGLGEFMRQKLRHLPSPIFGTETLQIFPSDSGSSLWQWSDGFQNSFQPPDHFSQPFQQCLKNALRTAEALFPQASRWERENWLHQALAVRLPGRLDLRHNLYTQEGLFFHEVLLDGGHNAEALLALIQQLDQWNWQNSTLIFGIAQDKLVPPAREALCQLFQRAGRVILTQAHSLRAATSAQILDFLAWPAEPQTKIKATPDLRKALSFAAQEPDFPLILAGSFYLVGEAFVEFRLEFCKSND